MIQRKNLWTSVLSQAMDVFADLESKNAAPPRIIPGRIMARKTDTDCQTIPGLVND